MHNPHALHLYASLKLSNFLLYWQHLKFNTDECWQGCCSLDQVCNDWHAMWSNCPKSCLIDNIAGLLLRFCPRLSTEFQWQEMECMFLPEICRRPSYTWAVQHYLSLVHACKCMYLCMQTQPIIWRTTACERPWRMCYMTMEWMSSWMAIYMCMNAHNQYM